MRDDLNCWTAVCELDTAGGMEGSNVFGEYVAEGSLAVCSKVYFLVPIHLD